MNIRRTWGLVALIAIAAAAFFLATAGTAVAAGDPVTYSYDANSPVASADATLRVVLVGFQKGQVDEQKILGQIPAVQRPGVLIPYDGDAGDSGDQCGAEQGGNTLLNHGRCYYEGGKPYLVPIEYRWKPKLIYAPSKFTSALFTYMMSTGVTKTGDFTGTTYRPYLEAYNVTKGNTRGSGNDVAPMAPVRFFDAEKMETWLAQNSLSYLGFDLGPKGGSALGPGKTPGYTIFVLNTWDSPEAVRRS